MPDIKIKANTMKYGIDDIIRYKIPGERGKGRVMSMNTTRRTYTIRALSGILVVSEDDVVELVKKHVRTGDPK